jgi:NAD(P)-dependent dehydrogenase (short-subunit alcohol dehydrogenase family)
MKTAVISGASYGIGSAITEAFLHEGWKVYGLSRSKPKFEHDHFVWLQCDLARSEQIAPALKKISEPVIELLVSNAGVIFYEAASAVTLERYENTYLVNVLAPMLIVKALHEKMRRATIISVSSVSDRLPDAEMALYGSSKAANTQYFNALAKELVGANVYTLLPDYVDTPMLRNYPPKEQNFNWDTIIQPEQIAMFCLRLSTEKPPLESGAHIIIVTEALKSSLENMEKLYGFNPETGSFLKLTN